eukprot:4035795-Prorocentrum_lima.AAC.1
MACATCAADRGSSEGKCQFVHRACEEGLAEEGAVLEEAGEAREGSAANRACAPSSRAKGG